MSSGGRANKTTAHVTQRRIPSVTAVGWHVMLSIAFMTAAIGGMGWLASEALETVRSGQIAFAAARMLVVVLLLSTIILGGKGIQAASRIGAVTGRQRQSMLQSTRSCFSWQGLLILVALVVGFAVEVGIALCVAAPDDRVG